MTIFDQVRGKVINADGSPVFRLLGVAIVG